MECLLTELMIFDLIARTVENAKLTVPTSTAAISLDRASAVALRECRRSAR